MTGINLQVPRRGYVLTVVLVTSFIVLSFTVILAGMVVLETARDRQAALEAQAIQAIASAQAWSRLHVKELAVGNVVSLPLDSLLPAGFRGQVELQRITPASSDAVIQCHVKLERAGRHLTRSAAWALGPSSPTSKPAP